MTGLIGMALLGAAGIRWEVPWPILAGFGLAHQLPFVAVGALVVWAVMARPAQASVGQLATGIASELRAGASLRVAVAEGCRRVGTDALSGPRRLAEAGAPIEMVADSLAAQSGGRLISAAVVVAARTGGRVAEVFEDLAALAREAQEHESETKTGTASARATALFMGGGPLLYLASMIATGRAADLWAEPWGPFVVAGGVGLVVAGLITIGLLVRSVGR